ncbi:50S ribosomal protein L7/L12 [bacterium]|nr:50S ribosomal protein L7/L12 [bacterium]
MADIDKIIEQLEKLTVVEVNELVKTLEERWGVSAAMAVAPAAMAAGGAGDAGAEEEKTSFDIVLKDPGDSKLQVIKIIREITSLGIKEAKELADNAPKPIKTGVPKEEAEGLRDRLVEVGAIVELA